MDSDGLPTSGGSLNRRIARGAAWMVGLHFVDRCIGFVSTIILARLLVPADFGLVAIAMALVAAVSVFGEFGLRSEEHTSELQSLMRISYAVFCLKKKKTNSNIMP